MEEQVESPNTLRDALEASFDLAEEGKLEAVVEHVPSEPVDRIRDEAGKFAKEAPTNPSPVATTHDVPEVPAEGLQRPTTWKKEYLPLWDKMQAGEVLTPEESRKILQYSNQRETEYKTGVSTYKTEAENARVLQEAISPFMEDLQANGIHPAAWINNLGRAHQVMVKGSPQQKLDTFVKLSQDYGVDLSPLLGGQQPDQQYIQQSQAYNDLQAKIDNQSKWIENEKNSRLQSQIDVVKNDAEKFPHFEAVRGTMAQLLESGLAPTLETAYAKAVRMQDDVWTVEQQRLVDAAKAEAVKSQHVAKAKAASVSLKSATPSGIASTSDKKDRRSALESAFDLHADGRV
ncbi:MAG: hypothetical protein NTW48_10110 [Chloroflexi bacterium]|nr:hypothetical protein [Chloroflexota bacterium]